MRSTTGKSSSRGWRRRGLWLSEGCGPPVSTRRTASGAAAKRGKAFHKWAQERKAWEAGNPQIDLERERRRFQSDILPVLSSISVNQTAKATGVSL
jgi:hypothetical protein